MTNSTKRLTDQWAANLIQWRIRIGPIARKYFTALGNVAIGLLATLTSFAALYYPQLRETLNAQSVETILYQLGATFGTILALVLTLSIIPIQRAGEVWSPAILLLYRRDPSTYITFLVLGVLCVASFLFAIKGFGGISASVVLAVAVGVLGLTLDLLRWYHGHVCQLLEPARAVGLAIKYARQAIDRIQHLVARTAKLQHRMLSSEQRNEVSTEDVETTIYPRLLGHSNSIIFWINDLAEIAAKATLRGERFLARAAVNAIGEIRNIICRLENRI